eukprot:9715181-Lingulodinium_polyedra.AAC.1
MQSWRLSGRRAGASRRCRWSSSAAQLMPSLLGLHAHRIHPWASGAVISILAAESGRQCVH